MRRVGTIWRLSVAGLAQSLLLFPVADSGSVCENAAAFHSAWTRHAGRDGVLRDRRSIAVSQHTERDPLVRAALAGGDGHHDGRDSDRAAALSREPGLRVPSRCVPTIHWILYRAGRRLTHCHLRLLGGLQHKFSGCRGARSGADYPTSHRVGGGAGGDSLPADEYERAGNDAVAGIDWTGGRECASLSGGGGGTAGLWRS